MHPERKPSVPTLVLALAVAGSLAYLWRGPDVVAGDVPGDAATDPPASARDTPLRGPDAPRRSAAGRSGLEPDAERTESPAENETDSGDATR